MKISIAIPHFNHKELLKQNLPSILESGADEVLIVDDGSSDDSALFVKDQFPLVKLLTNKTNMGFIFSVNKLFDIAAHEVVVLLNNDVSVDKNFLKPLIEHFKNPNVFAVNCHEQGESFAKAFWQDGFFQYQRVSKTDKPHRSSWASGGSAAYRKKIWQELNGFDPLFAPGYWEDVDLSFRALKAGYDILWEPRARVRHEHGTTMERVLRKRKIAWIVQRNQLLFIWKNITEKNLINEHKQALLKRLFGKVGLGYWIPFLWALGKKTQIKKINSQVVRTDLEVINYAD